MKPLKYFSFVILLWLLMLFFSHDYTAARSNHESQTMVKELAAGNYSFHIDKLNLDHVVSSFSHHWQPTNTGLKAMDDRPEISFILRDFRIMPVSHEQFQLSATASDSIDGQFLIELSNQAEQRFFHSGKLALNKLKEPLDLAQLAWATDQTANNTTNNTNVNWLEMGTLDALVLRFYGINTSEFVINGLSLKHHPVNITATTTNCDSFYCHITNKMRWQYNNALNLEGVFNLSYEKISQLPYWSWLLAAWLTAMFILRIQHAQTIKPYVLVGMVFMVILMVHQNWLLSWMGMLQWPLLVVLLLLVYAFRRHFVSINNKAAVVWSSAFLATLVLLSVNREVTLLSTIPTYFLWALVQQLMLGPLFSDCLRQSQKTTNFQTAFLVGVLFSIIHAPNHMLMLATFIGGTCWSFAWLRYQNIYANAFSHTMLALLYYQLMPDMWLGSARIGVFF